MAAFKCIFAYDKENKKVELVSHSSNVQRLVLSPTLALLLGYDPNETDLLKKPRAARPANIRAGLPSHMYVYCDLVEPQLVGDTAAPLLKLITIDTKSYVYGSYTTKLFSEPHYVPVIKSSFESVEIDLRDSTGDPLPFHFGTSCMKLHLRRQQQQQS